MTTYEKIVPAFAFVTAIFIGALIPHSVHAVSIGFEGVVSPTTHLGRNATPYTENGFTLTSNAVFFADDIFGAASGVNTNGTAVFGWSGSFPPTLTLTGPGVFSLLSIDFTNLDRGADASIIDVTGIFSSGGSIIASAEPTPGVWRTFNFPGFSGLSSLQILSRPFGPNMALDNIVVSTVTEPGSLVLVAAGVLGLGVATRRKRLSRIAKAHRRVM